MNWFDLRRNSPKCKRMSRTLLYSLAERQMTIVQRAWLQINWNDRDANEWRKSVKTWSCRGWAVTFHRKGSSLTRTYYLGCNNRNRQGEMTVSSNELKDCIFKEMDAESYQSPKEILCQGNWMRQTKLLSNTKLGTYCTAINSANIAIRVRV